MTKGNWGRTFTRSDCVHNLRPCGKIKSYYWCRYYCRDRPTCKFVRIKRKICKDCGMPMIHWPRKRHWVCSNCGRLEEYE